MDFSSNVAAQLNAGTILPEGIVIITLLLVLIVDLIGGRKVAFALPYLAIAGLLGATGMLVLSWSAADPIGFIGAFNGDNLSVIFRGIIALTTVITILM